MRACSEYKTFKIRGVDEARVDIGSGLGDVLKHLDLHFNLNGKAPYKCGKNLVNN